jgi:hypothetical protein
MLSSAIHSRLLLYRQMTCRKIHLRKRTQASYMTSGRAWKAKTSSDQMTNLRYFAGRNHEPNTFVALQDRTKADKRDCEKRPIIYAEGLDCTRTTAPDLS